MSSLSTILGLLLFCAQQALGYEVCKITSLKTYYCNDGYHCCNFNTQCCTDGLAVGAWAGIIVGIIVFKVIVITICVRMCRRYRARPVMAMRHPATITTISSPPPANTVIVNNQHPPTAGGYTNAMAYPPPKAGEMAPPPYSY